MTLGFLYKNGKYTDIPGPEGTRQSSANSINDGGAIVGSYVDSNEVMHGFLLKGKKYTTLDVPGATEGTGAMGINKHGWIVLYGYTSTGAASVLTKNNGKTYKTINVPGAIASFATDLDTAGDVVYQWFDSSHAPMARCCRLGNIISSTTPSQYSLMAAGLMTKAPS